MRMLTLAAVLATATATQAQTMPIGFGDLSPEAQKRLVEAWKKNFKSEVSALPPGQEAAKPTVAKPAPLPPPKAKGIVPYAELVERVKAGAFVTVRIVHDETTPNATDTALVCVDAPASLAAGTWAAWRDPDGSRLMRRLDAPAGPQQTAAPRQPIMSGSIGGGHWTWPGDLTDHLSGTHGQDPAKLAAMTPQQRATLHDQLHTGGASHRYQQYLAPQSFSVGQLINYGQGQSTCPTCPNYRR